MKYNNHQLIIKNHHKKLHTNKDITYFMNDLGINNFNILDVNELNDKQIIRESHICTNIAN